ncbi:EAL domain-containing protein [Dechloromonas sp. ZS-1]|uniref:EAL domain-containing protein n=1 Tax=Dechloromonas sp. ZS-1 TaxID=3138067 RepID=UPI0031FCA407
MNIHAAAIIGVTTILFVIERLAELASSTGTNIGEFIFLAGTLGVVSSSWGAHTFLHHASQKKQLEAAAAQIRHSIDNRRFVMFYQPIVDSESGAIVSCEALLRILDENDRPMAPPAFLADVERYGLQTYLSHAIISTVDSDFLEHGITLAVTVNLSLADISSDEVIMLLMAPRSFALNVEVTESTFLGATPHAMDSLNRLRSHGIKIYLDDFGTGYSSFTHLAEMPIDVLKIDREFIRKSQRTAKDAAICKSIVDLTKTINVRSVAEGVETQEEHKFLSAIGCDGVQGFLFHRPMAASELSAITSAACVK